jgi:deazaflavin-dependent oxidoreductase (nitroreductase family)
MPVDHNVGTRRGWLDRLWHGFAQVVSLAPITLVMMKLATWVDRPLMRLTRGRMRLSFVIPMVLVDARGAKSGLIRTVPLLYIPDGADMLVVGSNGGQRGDPMWCANLRSHPQVRCTVGGEIEECTATELGGTERDRAWAKALDVYPGYARYAARAERTIPVFRLSPTQL